MGKLVFLQNNRPVTDSLMVAESFGKNHKDVLRDIRNLECSEEFSQRNFAHTPYVHEQNGQEYHKYLITQDGFSFLVMGYTGKEAARFKEQYIAEFNRMREELTSISKPSYMIEDHIKRAEKWIEERRLLEQAETGRIAAVTKLEQQKPFVTFAETCLTSDKSLLVREVAKLASKSGVMIGEKRLYQKLRDWGVMMQYRNEPTQRAMEMGLFEIKKGVYAHPDGARDYATPKVTVKGQMYIIEKLKREQASETA